MQSFPTSIFCMKNFQTKDTKGSSCFPEFHFLGLELDASSSLTMLSQFEHPRIIPHYLKRSSATMLKLPTSSTTSDLGRTFNLIPRFMHRHGDADLTAIITSSVPPLDVSRVAIFQVHLSKYNLEALFGSHSGCRIGLHCGFKIVHCKPSPSQPEDPVTVSLQQGTKPVHICKLIGPI